MKVTQEKNDAVAKMIFAEIYPHYWNRLEKKGITKEEFHQVIEWFTGYNHKKIESLIEKKVTLKPFSKKQKSTRMHI